MLLKRLRDYADRLDLPPSMYGRTRIRWLIDLDRTGNLNGFVATTGEGKLGERGKDYHAPHVQRTAAVRPKLLADNAEYVLGFARDADKQDRVDRAHEAFVELVGDCARETGEEPVQAVAQFLQRMNLKKLHLPEDLDPSHVMTFRVEGILPIDLPAVQQYWAAATAEAGSQASVAMECLVCGRMTGVESRLPFKVKGIPGGQPSGTAIISANKPAFESYGLEASLTAPTCRDCAERFTKAANDLLRDEGKRLRVGPLAYLFWTRKDVGFSPVELLSRPTAEDVKALMEAAWKGRQGAVAVDPEPFYASALSASGGRVVVRDWLETTVPRVQENLRRFFRLQEITDPYEVVPQPYGIYSLAAATVRDLHRDLPPDTPRLLLSFALTGGRLPRGLLFKAVRRNRAEQRVTRPRAALIKMVLLSWLEEGKEDYMTKLDLESRDPAYLCGRLLAVLESIQRQALPGIKATLIDRFFGTASSAPASVFGTLMRMSQSHLAKLRKEKPGAYHALQRRIEDVVHPGLTSFPKTLTMQQQALFSLGFYHQQASDRSEAMAAKKDKKAVISESQAAEESA